jgi:hypothetical protein
MEDDNINKLEQEANLKGTMTFRNWTDSLNENIAPLKSHKVYHSTDSKFEDFSLDYAWDGFWFTDDLDSLKNRTAGASGGKYILTRYITLKNPAGWDEYDKYSIGELIGMGYDGVILPDPGRTDYIVFNPKSISKNIDSLNEVGEGSSKPYEWREDFDEYVFTTDSNVGYIVSLSEMPEGGKMGIAVEFLAKTPEMDGYSSKIEVGRGELFRVMATIIDIIKSYLSKDPEIEFILYSPSKKTGEGDIGNQRDKLYKIFLQKQIPGIRIRDIGTSAVIAYLPKRDELNLEINKPGDGNAAPYGSGYNKVNELRQGFLNYLKQQLPNFPDYVIKDWIYKMIKKDDNINTAEGIQDWIDTQLKDLKWETKINFPITMDIFGDKTQKELKSRIGGEIRQDVDKDIERHKTQQNLLKSQGISKEPIIIFKTKDGKYELGEGWHRTTQAFKMYPEGFIQPNVYIGLNAKWLDENLSKLKEEEDTSKIEDEFVKMMTKVASQATSAINAQTPVKISPELEKKLDEGQLNEFIDPITIATLVIGAPGLLKLLKWISQAVGWLIGQNKDGDNKFSKAFEKAEHKLHKFYIKLIGKGIKKAYPVYNAYTQEEVDILANKIYLGILTAALVASGMAAAKAAHGVIAAAGEGIHAGVTASDIVAIAGELATEV